MTYRSSAMTGVLLAFAVISVGEAADLSFDAGEAQAFAATQSAPGALASRTVARDIRLGLAMDATALSERLVPADLRALEGGVGSIDADSARLLSVFARASLLREAPSGDAVGLYNPLLDLWLVLGSTSDGALRYTAFVDGARLRSATTAWWEREGLYSEALTEVWRESAAGFDAAFATAGAAPDAAQAQADFQIVAQRLALAEQGLAAVQANESLSAALREGWRAQTQGKPGDARAMQLAALPSDALDLATAAAVVQRTDGVSAIYVSPLLPALYLCVDLDASGAPAGLTVVNLIEASP